MMRNPTILAAGAILLGGCLGVLAGPLRTGDEAPQPLSWYKGNTHTHTLNSDGDSSPGEVAHWYRDHDYDFLVLSDHNTFTVIDELQREIGQENRRAKRKPFLLIPGEEVTDGFKEGTRQYALHVNGVGTSRVVGKQGGTSVRDVLQRCIDGIRAAGGMPHVNHPNFGWSITADDLYSLRDLDHFEIFNGHPSVHNFGGGGSPSLEEMWDALLTRGRRLYGVAVDDAHNFKKTGPDLSNPGRGWVVARAPELSREAVIGALRRGDFYASTGVELEDISTAGGTLRLRIRKFEDFRFRTYFIGSGGKVLKVDDSFEPEYRLQDGEPYVRARVVSSGGHHAWTQPLFAQPSQGQ